ncbi:MAG: aminopeptidase [Oscillospiraceae bacterium]|nr:aminopeptidase [Oscillospiraceae bacterium]
MNRLYLIGLTGQTGAGKTTVSAELQKKGLAVVDADRAAHTVTEKGHPCLTALTRVFGNGILSPDGTMNRKAVAQMIFGDSAVKTRYEAVIYPYITQQIRASVRKLAAEGHTAVILDAPTLFESGLNRFCKTVVSVVAAPELRLSRILLRDTLTDEQARLRMQAQHSEDFYRAHSDYVIENNGDEVMLNRAVSDAAEYLRRTAAQFIVNSNTQKQEVIFMEEKKDIKALKEQLLCQPKHAAQLLDDKKIEAADAFCEGYKTFLDNGKTEREAAAYAAKLLEEKGFRLWKRGDAVKSGDKIYMCNRGKAIVAAVIGREPLESGIHLTASHIDSPRLDLKQRPLYEDQELALFKTHYYGGIKKYQWTVIPMALHGVVVRADGTSVQITVGEDADDPIFCVTDLLPHLAQEQAKRPLGQGIKGEELNLLIGSRPVRSEEGGDLVKLRIMQLLNEKYGITEADFRSAELEIVPAGKARDLGFDRSMIGAYGHDDRVCSYPALAALLDTENPVHTAVLILTDKEEIGSDGNTGLCSAYFHDFMKDLAEAFGTQAHTVFAKSQCLSADVTAAYDPTFSDVNDRTNCAYLNYGVCMMKYTGSRGKSGSSDASAEFIGKMRRVFDSAGVIWQTGELGKVDAGGGGTVAVYLANLNIDTVDVGVPVLSMHAPLEVVSKIDVFMAYEAFKAFNQSENN